MMKKKTKKQVRTPMRKWPDRCWSGWDGESLTVAQLQHAQKLVDLMPEAAKMEDAIYQRTVWVVAASFALGLRVGLDLLQDEMKALTNDKVSRIQLRLINARRNG